MKTIKQLLITIAVLLCSTTTYAYDFEVDGIYYNIISTTDFTAEVTSGNTGYSGSVSIPSTVSYSGIVYNVISIGKNAFSYYDSNLTSITIPEGVISIGYSAFYGCSGLTSITIPESVTSIGNKAFNDCTSLKDLRIEDGNTTLDLGYNSYDYDGLFYDCPLETLYLGRNLSYSTSSSYGYSPFYNQDELKSLTISNSVTSIGYYAFSRCSGLTSITIPESVTSIGYSAFNDCTSLKDLRIEDGNTTLDLGYNSYDYGGLFYDCPLETLYLGRNLSYSTSSSYYSPFYNQDELKSLTISNSVTSIGDYAFCGCSCLTSITIPESVTSIGKGAFRNCSGLTSITIPESVTSIGYSAFNGCSGLTSITIPESVTSISDYAFSGCSGLTSITIPESVTSIGEGAFSNCSGLTSITIPESVTSIGNDAFNFCTSLKDLRIEDGDTTLELGYRYDINYARALFSHCSLESVYLGRNLSYDSSIEFFYIVEEPFYNINTLYSVIIGPKVTNIGNGIFSRCDNIHSLTINSGVVSIGEDAFSTPNKVIWLTNTPPKGYYYAEGRINYVANEQYTSLDNVHVYPYLSSIFETDGVKYVPVSPSERTCHAIDCVYDSTATVINIEETVSFQGVDMNVIEVMPFTFYGNNYVQDVSVSHYGNIGNQAFYNCSSLSNITLGNNVSSFGNEAFYQCVCLQEIVIPESIDTISESCFEGCSALANVDLGQGVNVINKYAFQDCSALSQISIPKSVKEIEDNVFKGCTALSDIIIEDRNEILSLGSNGSSALFADCPLDSLYIGGKIAYETSSSCGRSPFYRNTSLRTVVITNKEDQIYDNEFYGCTNLKNVVIGHGVESIGDYAFSGCSNLDGFSFGSNLKTIGTEAFSDCTNITSITSHAEVPPTCGEQALDDINKWTCVLKVPQNYASAYQSAEQWKEFFYIEDVVEIELFTITYIVDGEVYATGKYAVGDEIIPEEEPIKEGYTFSGWSEIPETMPAEDVTVTGSFSINSYDLVYMIDGEEYKRVTLEFGSEIVPEEEPEKEGYTFSGWSEIPETMPAHDVEVTGSFILTNVSEITAKVSLQINGNNISLSNANNSTVAIYSINGVLVKKIDKYAGEEITLEKGVYIVSVGDKAMKIKL